jgi:NADH:ubiquinone oxidoreductase subunit 5 (subunit L)/multisubunit Na+/H+ antiporter MnhA subunit
MKHDSQPSTLPHPTPTISSVALGWALALLPALAFAFFAPQLPALTQGDVLTWSLNWLPSLGVRFSFYLDGLSGLFALLVTGIGAGILVYAGYYFSHTEPTQDERRNTNSASSVSRWLPVESRFFLFLVLFTIAMLGLVLAGDIITLFVFWEGTSITSFLLVGYKYKLESARRGAFKALFVTGGGGIALMAGLLFAANIAGSSDLATILTSGDVLRASPLYSVMLGLIALGAFTKSAQFPAHFWLPNAMSAPTPASAFLHSATMVKAGIYLMARLHPALGGTEMWFWLLSSAGLLTMFTGAVIGLRQNDLKGLLAYSTISQLGALMMLIGQNTSEAFKALIVGILAHALYKATLFLIAGIVDHGTGTRDLRDFAKMSLHKAMPIALIIGAVAALSMAGLPPLFGFLAKETLLAAATTNDLPFLASVVFPVISVIVGALMLVQAAILIIDTFFGQGLPKISTAPLGITVRAQSITTQPITNNPSAHEAPLGMLLVPAILAVLSLVFALVPSLTSPTDSPLARFVATAAAQSYGEKVKVNLALFTGFNTALALSGVAIAAGAVIFAMRKRWLNRESYEIEPKFNVRRVYTATLLGLDRLARTATHLQGGSLRTYLAIMLVAIGVLVSLAGRLPIGSLTRFSFDQLSLLRAFSLLLVVAASAASVVMKRDLLAILALGASGLAMALLIALEPSPDVALVQIVVDILTTMLLLYALMKLPKDGGLPGGIKVKHDAPKRLFDSRNALLALGSGVVMAAICFFALTSRPRESLVTPYYEQNSKPLTGAADIVGAIVVDFRGFDTMIEISVFSMAGLAVYTLLQFAASKGRGTRDEGQEIVSLVPHPSSLIPSLGITGPLLSPFIRTLARLVLPLALVVGATHIIYGHNQPGDGFTAGVIISLAIGFMVLVYGREEALRRMPWVKPPMFVGAGILTVMVGSIAPALLGSSFFAPYDFGAALNLPLPAGFYFSTSLLFEIAICLAVMGSTSFMVETLTNERD